MPRNIKLVLSYDGADFAGWQVQPAAATIQGALASAIGRVTGENVLPQGSGRTDAGVHAHYQVASFFTQSSIPAENLSKALNDTLPPSVRVLSSEEVSSDFHARKSARAKTYVYRVYRATICPPFLARYVWHYPYQLDLDPMREAALEIVGEQDFTSFAAVDPERGREEAASNVRCVFSSEWRSEGDEWIYAVRGNGFLHHMVRNLVGTFVLAGRRTIPPLAIREILRERKRSAAGATAPASGLFLADVEY